jgi:hypothetical protein
LVAEEIVAPEALVFLYDVFALPQIGEWRALYDAMDNSTLNRGKLALTAATMETTLVLHRRECSRQHVLPARLTA